MDREAFAKHGFVVLKQALNNEEMTMLETEHSNLVNHSQNILAALNKTGESFGDFYPKHMQELIVVPESDDPLKVCRYEYIKGFNAAIREKLVPKIQGFIKQLTGEDFVLFKDKLNAKNPGGGAFKPHQDVIAYHHLKPNFHITVGVHLDEATVENGCLFVAEDYKRDLHGNTYELKDTPNGKLPILPSYDGGSNNGAIHQEVVDTLTWQPITAKPGDIVLFDSYLPHKSDKNASSGPRRVFFFTFNALHFGDFYSDYYDMKHREFDNPKFHVATPTNHAKS